MSQKESESDDNSSSGCGMNAIWFSFALATASGFMANSRLSIVVNFTNLGDYDVHFVTFNDVMLSTDSELLAHRLSNDGGSSFITSGYHFAIQYNSDDGGNGESKSTSYGYLSTLGASGNAVREVKNGYVYYYNLLDSTKYSFCTVHSYSKASVSEALFGGGVLPTAEVHNAISFLTSGGSAITSGDFSLYGIKEYS